MTKKRFKVNADYLNNIDSIIDNKTGIEHDYLEIEELLNELAEENKELKYKYDEQSNEKMGLEEDVDRLLKKNKELKYHLNKTEKELKEYKDFMSLG